MKSSTLPTGQTHSLPLYRGLGLALAASLLIGPSARATSDTWSGAIDGDWSNTSNWISGNAPGATSGTTNTDTATFDSNPANRTITVDAGRNIKFITFDTTNAGSYTIGNAGVNAGNTLALTSAGAVTLSATVPDGVTETFNAPLSLAGSVKFDNQSTGTARFVIAGNITNTATSTLTIATAASGASGSNIVSGVISDGTGVMSVLIGSSFSGGSGVGSVEFSGANTYSGQTKINLGATGLFTTSGTNSSAGTTYIQHGILNLNNASNGGLASGTLTMEAGTMQAQTAAAGTLSNAVSLANNSTVTGAQNITLNGDFTNITTGKSLTNTINSGGTLTLNGKVNLGSTTSSGSTLIISGTGNTVINGVVQDFSGGVGTAAGNLTLNATTGGVITLTAVNTYTGATTIYGAGKTVVSNVGNSGSSSNLGTTGTINFGQTTTSGILSYTGAGETSNKVINLAGTTGGATLEQAGTGLLKFTSDLTAVGAGAKTLTLQGSTAGTGEISGLIVDNSGTNLTRLTKTGSGTWTLSGANTYTGATTINGGVLVATSLANGGVASSIGQSSNAAANLVINGGTLKYTGGTASTDRVLTIGTTAGSAIDASGTGALTLTASTITLSGSNTARSLSLAGSNTADNTFSTLLANNGTGKTSLTKDGAGTWVLSGANTYTGATTVNAGTLALGAADRIANGSALVMNGGTFATRGFSETLGTLTLSASSTIDLGSGASALVFADSSATSWGSSISLSFVNFDAGTDSIRIGTTSGGVTGTQLGQITLNGLAASIDSSGFLSVSAVPEPSTYALLAGAGTLLCAFVRRKVRASRAG